VLLDILLKVLIYM